MKYLILGSISIIIFILYMIIVHSKIKSNKYLERFFNIAISIPICMIIILLIYDHTEFLKDFIIATSILIAYVIIQVIIWKMYKKDRFNKYIYFIILVLISFITIYGMNIYLLIAMPYNFAIVMPIAVMQSLLKDEKMHGYKPKVLFVLFCVLLVLSVSVVVTIWNQNSDGTSKPMHKAKNYLIEEMKIDKNEIYRINQHSGDNKKEKVVWVYIKEKKQIVHYEFTYFEGQIKLK